MKNKQDILKLHPMIGRLTHMQWDEIHKAMDAYLNEYKTEQLALTNVSKSFTYKDISKVAEDLANEYSSDKKDPVWQDIKQDGIKAIQAFISKHL